MPSAKSAPKRENKSAWLSLDGRPKYQAQTPKTTMVIKQQRQIRVASCFPLTFIKEKTVFATPAPPSEVTKTPKKLKMLDKSAPCQSFKMPELTIEKIEFGASVQPLTKTTAKASKNTKKSRGVFNFVKKSIAFILDLPTFGCLWQNPFPYIKCI